MVGNCESGGGAECGADGGGGGGGRGGRGGLEYCAEQWWVCPQSNEVDLSCGRGPRMKWMAWTNIGIA